MDEVIAARENNLVYAKLFRRINHMGKKGDVLHMPSISNMTASSKLESTEVTLIASAESDTTILLDKHEEVSHLYEDFAMVQEAYHIRQEYTKKAGYALAKKIDTDVNALIDGISNTSPDHWMEGDGSDANKGSVVAVGLTKAGVIEAIMKLDQADVPGNRHDRFLIINPSTKAQLLGIDDFTMYMEFGQNPTPLKTGLWGEIMGVDVYMTNNHGSNNSVECIVMGHADAFVSAIQMDVRVQAQYMQLWLSTLVTSDVIYGTKTLRDDHAVVITVGPGV